MRGFLLFLASTALSLVCGEIVSLENSLVSLQFDTENGALVGLQDKSASSNLIDANEVGKDIESWSFKFVDSVGSLKLGQRKGGEPSFEKYETYDVLKIFWKNIPVYRFTGHQVASINVQFSAKLDNAASVSEWSVAFTVNEGSSQIGIWEADITIPVSIASDEDGELFYPTGFGTIFSNPKVSTGGSRSRTYPCGEGSMQFMALGSSKQSSAAYMSALDVAGEAKLLQYSAKTSVPTLGITVYPENAGVHLAAGSTWSLPYSIAVGVVSGVSAEAGRPLWYEAAIIYREWTLKNARWTQEGPLSARKEMYPSWYTDTSIWINTHWMCHDIFNETGGDPNFVLPYTTQIVERLQEPSLSLHWYEWQQGPDPAPEARYLFDTHYPDYFPARTNFKDAVQQLADIGVKTFPYINGRISDINSESYLNDNGEVYCSKETLVRLVNETDPKPLLPYVETYGSNASFCVTNPFTSYWQDKTADIVSELVHDYNVAGVYIDQIASAVPKLCWDSVHEHSLGGGDFWTEGYQQMMDAVQDSIKDTYSRPMVTEDNAEPYMNMVQGYLTLNAFKHSFSQNTEDALPATSRIAPAFPMVYGGYYVGFGAIWSRADFADKDWFCGKLASMLTTGSQLGWFSLVGIDNDPEDSCGPMGVGDLMLDSANDDLIEYLQHLARSRAAIVDYFVNGNMARPPVLNPQPASLVHTVDSTDYDYDTVITSAWRNTQGSVVAVLASTVEEDYNGELIVNFSSWGFDAVSSLNVWSVSSTGDKALLGVVQGPSASWTLNIPARKVVMLEFVPTA